MPDDDVERIPVRRLDDDGGAELVDRGDPDDDVEEVLARLGAPLDEVMLTQRAVRKVRSTRSTTGSCCGPSSLA